MDFLLFLIQIIVWLIIIVGPILVVYLIYKIRNTAKVIEHVEERQYTLLRILVPKQNEKTPLAAEEMFASIHGIYRPDQAIQDHLSFEISARDQYIQFFVYVPKPLKDFVEGQIYAQYPTVEISEVQDYTDISLDNWSVAAAELVLTKPDYYPIKTFMNFQVDPLAAITSVLSKIDEGEQIWIQILVRPIPDIWQEKTLKYVKMIEEGKKPGGDNKTTISKILQGTAGVVTELARTAAGAPAKEAEKKEKPSLPGPVTEALRAAETKTTKLGYETLIRVCAIAKDEGAAVAKINNLLGAFKQYNVTNMNGFSISRIATDKEKILPVFQTRAFPATGYIFNVEELASIYHLPSQSVETPSIVWAGAKKGEPPANLPIEGLADPKDVTLFAQTNYRHFNHRFGIKTPDRRYHMYAIGKTGTGKSTMLRNMIIDDIQKGRGVCVVDPHGDLIQHVLDFIPDNRVDDVVYFNPADRENPIGFNLLESVDPDLRSIVASGLMSIFTKLWANVWSARMEYILRNVVLALLEYPDATLLEIMKLLVDPVFRRKVLYYVKDPVIREFFINEYEKYDPKFRTEAIAPIQNKVGQFLSSSTIRNIMGQMHSTIDMRQIMDSGKILLVDLSVGKIGEDNAALLGSMIITKIQLAAMGRADQPEEQRKDFYLYVDEFQNFATESFAVILSEARKYHLNLIITHQYIAQMPEVVASAVFGNVGTIVAFRVGASDAGALAKEFEPVFDANDLVNLDNYHVYLKMAIDARTATPFSALTLPPFNGKNENRQKAIDQSIAKYAANRQKVEEEIMTRNEANSGKIGTLMEVDGEIIYKEELKPYEPMNPLPKNYVFDGQEIWKVRDKEGQPFYVSPRDYDSFMESKGKPSDRPGAAVDTDLIDPESLKLQQQGPPNRSTPQQPVAQPAQPQNQSRGEAGRRDSRDASARDTARDNQDQNRSRGRDRRDDRRNDRRDGARNNSQNNSSRDSGSRANSGRENDRGNNGGDSQANRQSNPQRQVIQPGGVVRLNTVITPQPALPPDQISGEDPNIVRHQNSEKNPDLAINNSPATKLTVPPQLAPQVEAGESIKQVVTLEEREKLPVVAKNQPDLPAPIQPTPSLPSVQSQSEEPRPVTPPGNQSADQDGQSDIIPLKEL